MEFLSHSEYSPLSPWLTKPDSLPLSLPPPTPQVSPGHRPCSLLHLQPVLSGTSLAIHVAPFRSLSPSVYSRIHSQRQKDHNSHHTHFTRLQFRNVTPAHHYGSELLPQEKQGHQGKPTRVCSLCKCDQETRRQPDTEGASRTGQIAAPERTGTSSAPIIKLEQHTSPHPYLQNH